MTEPDQQHHITQEQAAAQGAELNEHLRQPIMTVIDAEIREISDAANQLMQVPLNGGERYWGSYSAAIGYLMQARELMRRCTP